MGMPSGMELLVLVAVIVLLFGGKKIPELAKGLGQGIKNFKNAVKEDEPEATTTAKKDTDKIETEATVNTTTTAEATTNTDTTKTV
ncbi:MAG TPA: twin-arginine translocase TatA/TatE family subunit [Arcobacter sp.]|nr:twin-arginine translocase TatA/TatE family subunit [Arcobacter sp.]